MMVMAPNAANNPVALQVASGTSGWAGYCSGEFQNHRLRRQPSPPPAPQPSARLPLVTHDVQLSPALSEIPHFVEARAENLLPKI